MQKFKNSCLRICFYSGMIKIYMDKVRRVVEQKFEKNKYRRFNWL